MICFMSSEKVVMHTFKKPSAQPILHLECIIFMSENGFKGKRKSSTVLDFIPKESI